MKTMFQALCACLLAVVWLPFTATANLITLDKKYYLVKYSDTHKGATRVSYQLSRKTVNANNLKKRPKFYTDKRLPRKAQTHYSDYTNTGYDRGHLANDASFDWSKKSQKSTYSMSNIVPQLPTVNRNAWLAVEKMERYSAQQFPTLDVLNIVEYRNNAILQKKPLSTLLAKKRFSSAKSKEKFINRYKRTQRYMTKKAIRIPSGFYKILSNPKYGFQECYYVPNTPKITSRDARNYQINCSSVPQ